MCRFFSVHGIGQNIFFSNFYSLLTDKNKTDFAIGVQHIVSVHCLVFVIEQNLFAVVLAPALLEYW